MGKLDMFDGVVPFVTIVELGSFQRAATALGIMDFAFAIAGFLAPAITGWVLDLRGSFADGFLLMTALALAAVLVVLLFHHPDRDQETRSPSDRCP